MESASQPKNSCNFSNMEEKTDFERYIDRVREGEHNITLPDKKPSMNFKQEDEDFFKENTRQANGDIILNDDKINNLEEILRDRHKPTAEVKGEIIDSKSGRLGCIIATFDGYVLKIGTHNWNRKHIEANIDYAEFLTSINKSGFCPIIDWTCATDKFYIVMINAGKSLDSEIKNPEKSKKDSIDKLSKLLDDYLFGGNCIRTDICEQGANSASIYYVSIIDVLDRIKDRDIIKNKSIIDNIKKNLNEFIIYVIQTMPDNAPVCPGITDADISNIFENMIIDQGWTENRLKIYETYLKKKYEHTGEIVIAKTAFENRYWVYPAITIGMVYGALQKKYKEDEKDVVELFYAKALNFISGHNFHNENIEGKFNNVKLNEKLFHFGAFYTHFLSIISEPNDSRLELLLEKLKDLAEI